IVANLPDFNGPFNNSDLPFDYGAVGTFTFVIPGTAIITSAIFSGTYGTAAYSTSTASFDATIEGENFSVCPVYSAGCYNDGSPFRPFSIALAPSTFAGFLDGSAALDLIQTTGNYIRLGSPTLTINYTVADVPVPGALALLGFGLIGLGAQRRRKTI